MQQNISVIRGTTNTFNVSIVDANGDPYVLQTGETLIFGVKSNSNNSDYNISKTMTSADLVDGKYQFTIEPEDTINMLFGKYSYDIGLQSDDDYFNVIECSDFYINKNITKAVLSNA